jgi:iron complex transport system permease protein
VRRLRRPGLTAGGATLVLIVALIAGVSLGPVSMPVSTIAGALLAHLPWHPATGAPPIDSAIIWQLRLPRVVLGALAGAMLSGGGAAYQGVFRNPLADPYLLGVAAGAGLGATVVIISGGSRPCFPPPPLAAGSPRLCDLPLARAPPTRRGRRDRESRGHGLHPARGCGGRGATTAAQTYMQQAHPDAPVVYSWIPAACPARPEPGPADHPYVIVAGIALLAHRYCSTCSGR